MNIFENLLPVDLYHSYIIEGAPEETSKNLIEFLKIRETNNPDILFQTYESFTIDDSGEIKDWHSKKNINNSKKICIIATKFINREAEQTLLKIIEEPAENTHFFIVVPDSSALLDTILSRTHLVKTDQEGNKDIQKEALSFVALKPKDRIEKITLIIKENKDEENSGQLRYYATSFINELENIFYQKWKNNKNDKNIRFILEELQKSRSYLSTQGASVKMILEHIALVL